MTTNWNIFNTERQTTDGVITKVTYGCTAQLGTYIDRTVGQLKLTGDASTEGFIPYENLTEVAIVEWVKSSLGHLKVLEIETSLQSKVTTQKEAKEEKTATNGLPWRK